MSKIARKVARRALIAYTASSEFEKTVGQIVSRQYGITNAPEEFFKRVQERVEGLLEGEDLEMDLSDPVIYPHIQTSIIDVMVDMGILEKK